MRAARDDNDTAGKSHGSGERVGDVVASSRPETRLPRLPRARVKSDDASAQAAYERRFGHSTSAAVLKAIWDKSMPFAAAALGGRANPTNVRSRSENLDD